MSKLFYLIPCLCIKLIGKCEKAQEILELMAWDVFTMPETKGFDFFLVLFFFFFFLKTWNNFLFSFTFSFDQEKKSRTSNLRSEHMGLRVILVPSA